MAIKVWGAGSTQGSDGYWDTASNWDNDTVPVDGDSLLFDASALYGILNGPLTASVIIENIQVTSGYSQILSLTSNFPLIVVGQLNSALSSYAIGITIYPYGITSIVGAWYGTVIVPNDKPVNPSGVAYLGISQVLFDTSNYLELNGYGINELKYGLSDIYLNVSGEAPFTSFIIDTISGNLNGFPLTGVFKITSQVIEFNSTVIQINGLQLDAPIVNITQIGALINYNTGPLPLLSFNQSCTLNISSPSSMIYPNPINTNLKFNFFSGGTINLYGQATIYGTNSPIGIMGTLVSEVLLFSPSPLVINAYNNSLVGGICVEGAFTDTTLIASFGSFCTITMLDNSIFQGMIISGMFLTSISFLNSSNVSFKYQLGNNGSGGTYFQAYPSTVVVGEGDIPQSVTGLTIFKSSF